MLDEWMGHARALDRAWILSHRAMQLRIDGLERELHAKSAELYDRVSEEVAASLAADASENPFA